MTLLPSKTRAVYLDAEQREAVRYELVWVDAPLAHDGLLAAYTLNQARKGEHEATEVPTS